MKKPALSEEEVIALLEKNGWNQDCSSPLEFSHKDGSFASGQAARLLLYRYKDVIE